MKVPIKILVIKMNASRISKHKTNKQAFNKKNEIIRQAIAKLKLI